MVGSFTKSDLRHDCQTKVDFMQLAANGSKLYEKEYTQFKLRLSVARVGAIEKVPQSHGDTPYG